MICHYIQDALTTTKSEFLISCLKFKQFIGATFSNTIWKAHDVPAGSILIEFILFPFSIWNQNHSWLVFENIGAEHVVVVFIFILFLATCLEQSACNILISLCSANCHWKQFFLSKRGIHENLNYIVMSWFIVYSITSQILRSPNYCFHHFQILITKMNWSVDWPIFNQ